MVYNHKRKEGASILNFFISRQHDRFRL